MSIISRPQRMIILISGNMNGNYKKKLPSKRGASGHNKKKANHFILCTWRVTVEYLIALK
jgi:hypothetical protein